MKKTVIHSRLETRKNARNRGIYEHFNQHYLHVSELRQGVNIDYIVDLAVLKPESHYVINIPWNWLVISALAIGVFAGLLTHVLFNPDMRTILIFFPLLLMLFVFVILALRQFVIAYERKCVFLSRYAAYPILEIPFESKNKERFYNFIEQLENQIQISINSRNIPEEVLQAGEMKTLRRLSTKGVLTKNQYNTAKNRIFRKLDTLSDY